jgi:hypothetical protein
MVHYNAACKIMVKKVLHGKRFVIVVQGLRMPRDS